MDPDLAYTKVSSLSKINMDLVRMDSRRDSAVGIASANSEAINAPSPLGSYSSVLSQPKDDTSYTLEQYDMLDTPAQETDKLTESSKAKKKKKKKGKGATIGTTLSDVSSHLENPGDTSPDSGGGRYQPPDSDDLEWLESAVVKGDTKPTGKKSKTKKKPSKRNDSKKSVEYNDGDRIVPTDDENNQESEGKADDTTEEDTIDSHNIDMGEYKNIPTDSLAFIEDDSFMNEGGTSNWADDMAELDPQPWAAMSLGGECNSAADHGSPITPPSSTSSSIASSSTLVSRTSPRADDPQESRSTSLPIAQPQDARFYERQDRRPPRPDHRGQPRPPRPDRPPRQSSAHLKDPQARPHYPPNYSERTERPERPPRPMRPRPERHHGYENWVPSAADPRDHHAVSQKPNQRQPRSHPLPPRPDVPFAGAHVPPHHYPLGHPGQGYPGLGYLDHGQRHGHPGYLVDSDLHVTPGPDRFFHARPRPRSGYEMFATDTNGHPSRQDNHWRKKQPQQQQQHQHKREKKNKQGQEQQQQDHEDITPTLPTRAMSEAAPEPGANRPIASLEHIDTDEAVPPLVADRAVAPALATDDVVSAPPGDEAPRPRAIMGLAMFGRQVEPWEDRAKVIEILNRRWTEAMRSVGLEENATAIFYTSEM